MSEKDFDAILENLDCKAKQKRDIALATAKAELETIQQKYVAYYDGVYDALKAVKIVLKKQEDDDATT